MDKSAAEATGENLQLTHLTDYRSRRSGQNFKLRFFHARTKRTIISVMLRRRAATASGASASSRKIRLKVCWFETLKKVKAEIDA